MEYYLIFIIDKLRVSNDFGENFALCEILALFFPNEELDQP